MSDRVLKNNEITEMFLKYFCGKHLLHNGDRTQL